MCGSEQGSSGYRKKGISYQINPTYEILTFLVLLTFREETGPKTND